MGWKTQILKQRAKEEKQRQKELENANKKDKQYCCCYNCINAYLMQSSPYNPIVAECKITKERQVAKMYQCGINKFSSSSGTTTIIHEMKPAPLF